MQLRSGLPNAGTGPQFSAGHLSFFLIRIRVLLTVLCKSLDFLIEISSGLSLLNAKTPAKAGVFALSVGAASGLLQSGRFKVENS